MKHFRHITVVSILLAFLVAWAPPLHAEEASFDVQVLGDARKALPGEVTTVAIRLTNLQTVMRRLTVETALPSNWQLVVPIAAVELGAGEQKMLLLHVRVATRALPGTHELHVTIFAEGVARESRRETVAVEVLPVLGLDLRLEGVPRVMQPGVAYTSGVVAINEGNVPIAVHLDGNLSNWATLQFGESAPSLQAWEARQIEVTVTPGANQKGGDRALVVQARAPGVADPVQVTETVLLIVSAHAEKERRTFFPVEIGVGATGGSRGSGGQLTMSGRGALWEDADHEIDFDVRVPDNRQHAFLGRRDEYRLRFRNDRLSLHLGDHNYALSPLTDVGRPGYGAAGSLRTGDTAFGALYSRSRMNIFEDVQYGVHAGYHLGSTSLIGLQFVGRDGLRAGQAVTMRAVTSLAGTQMDAEVGRSGSGEQAGTSYQVQLAGRRSWLSYNARLMHIGPEGMGLHWNTDLRDVRATAQPWKGIRIDGGWQDIAQKISHSLLDRHRTYHAGAAWNGKLAGRHVHARLEWNDRDERMYGPDEVQKRGFGSTRLQTGLKSRSGGVEASAELGRVATSSTTSPFQAFRMNGHVNLPHGQMNATVAYRSGSRTHQSFRMNEWSFDAGLVTQIGRRTKASVHGLLLFSRGRHDMTTSHVTARLSHVFPRGHEITAEGRYRTFGNSNLTGGDAEYSISYKIPVGIPIPSKRVGFDVAGRIYDGETGEPLAGVVLHLGESVTLSRQDGTFVFRRLPDGIFLLEPNGADVGLDRIAMQGRLIEVHVDGEDVSGVEVAIVRSASIEGRGVIYDEAPRRLGETETNSLIERSGLAGVILEITDGHERLHVTTNDDGRFNITGLRPGSWTVRVVSGEIPPSHHIADFPPRLDLSPAAEAQFEIEVLPRKRQLRIIERGTVQ